MPKTKKNGKQNEKNEAPVNEPLDEQNGKQNEKNEAPVNEPLDEQNQSPPQNETKAKAATATTGYSADSPNFYTFIKTVMESPDDLSPDDFKEADLFINLGQDLVRSKLPTFELSDASRSALRDFLGSEALGIAIDLINRLREHKRYMLPLICVSLVTYDFRRAIKALPPKKTENGDIPDNRETGERKKPSGAYDPAPTW